MSVPVQSAVEALLRPYAAPVAQLVYGAWADWMASCERTRIRYPRTRANLVWEFMAARAVTLFAGDPRVRTIQSSQTVAFVVDGKVLLRFKMGDEHGLSRNYPTQLALAYHDHEQDLFGDDVARVEIVYVLDKLQTEIECVLVVARNKEKIAWFYALDNAPPQAEVLPLRPDGDPNDTAKLVRVRGEPNQDKEEKKDHGGSV